MDKDLLFGLKILAVIYLVVGGAMVVFDFFHSNFEGLF